METQMKIKTGRKGEEKGEWNPRRKDEEEEEEEGGGSSGAMRAALEKGRREGPKGERTREGGGEGRETGAMRLERGGLDVGRPERARTTALGRFCFFFFPSTLDQPSPRHRHPRRPAALPCPDVATAPIHKFPYITPLLQSRNERQPIQGSVTRL